MHYDSHGALRGRRAFAGGPVRGLRVVQQQENRQQSQQDNQQDSQQDQQQRSQQHDLHQTPDTPGTDKTR